MEIFKCPVINFAKMDGIIRQLQKILGRAGGTEMFVEKPGSRSVPFSLENFRTLPNTISRKTFFVDGGQAVLFETAEMVIGLIRIAVISQNGAETNLVQREQYYIIIHTIMTENGLLYEAVIEGKSFIINPHDAALKDGIVRANLSKALDVIRKMKEFEAASKLPEEILVVLDGELDAKAELEKKAIEKLKENVIGLVKSQSLLTNTGASLYMSLTDMAPDSSWWYWPIIKNSKVDWIVSRLSAEAYQPYRIDFLPDAKKEEILAVMRACSQDLSLPGYPYGLLVADQYARITVAEASLLKTRLINELSKESKLLNDGFDTHEMLNRIVLRLSR